MNETRQLATFLSELRFDDLPPDVVDTAKSCVLDTVGVALAASARPWSRIVAQTAAESGGAEASTLWGHGMRSSPQQAALANGTSAHGIEMDDRVPPAEEHPGCVTVPAALAVAEQAGGTGRDLITAVVAGYEAGIRVGLAVRFGKQGLHPPGHKGVWSAVAAAGSGLGLDAGRMRDALGLAGSMASGIWEFSQDAQGTMVKRLHAGIAAHNGVLAAVLASKGFTGPATVLEGPFGYCTVFCPPGQEPRLDELTRGLGREFRIREREVKPYASCGGLHTVVDAVAVMAGEHPIEVDDVVEVRVGGSSRLLRTHEDPRPRSLMGAQYSLPFVAGVALAHGAPALMDPDGIWTEEILDDARVLGLSTRTVLEVDDEMERAAEREGTFGGARLAVTLRDGTTRHSVVHYSKGTLGNPMTAGDVEEKFRRLTARTLGADGAQRVIDLVAGLEDVADVRTLAELLRDGATAPAHTAQEGRRRGFRFDRGAARGR